MLELAARVEHVHRKRMLEVRALRGRHLKANAPFGIFCLLCHDELQRGDRLSQSARIQLTPPALFNGDGAVPVSSSAGDRVARRQAESMESNDARRHSEHDNHKEHAHMTPKNTICLWFDKEALDAARFYEATFPDSHVAAVHHAPSNHPSGKQGDVLTVEFTVCGIPCIGLNGGTTFKQSEAFSFQIATDSQEETDRYWNAIVGNGGQESQCGWCKDRWGVSWQITPRVLTEAFAAGGQEAKRAFDAMMPMRKIDVATIEAARRG
jgi:predicted 3-demethylubiquinone-9 3-methyltransferase (glyoxalase superfamily)